MNIKEMIYNEIESAFTRVMTTVIEARPVVEIEVVEDALAGQPRAIQAMKRSKSAPQIGPQIAEVEEEFSRIWAAMFDKAEGEPSEHIVLRHKAVGEAVEVAKFKGGLAQLSETTRKAIEDVDHAARAMAEDARGSAEEVSVRARGVIFGGDLGAAGGGACPTTSSFDLGGHRAHR